MLCLYAQATASINRVEDTGDDYPQRLRMVFAHVMTHLPVFIGILAIGHKGRDLGQIVVMPAAMSWPRGCARRGETAPLNLWERHHPGSSGSGR